MLVGIWLAHAAISIEGVVSNKFLLCWLAFRINEASFAQASAPFLLRLPPLVLRATTAGRCR
jgi:hypothetical protein